MRNPKVLPERIHASGWRYSIYFDFYGYNRQQNQLMGYSGPLTQNKKYETWSCTICTTNNVSGIVLPSKRWIAITYTFYMKCSTAGKHRRFHRSLTYGFTAFISNGR